MSKVLHEDKINIDSLPDLAQVNKWTDDNINEHKRVINEHDDRIAAIEIGDTNEVPDVSAIYVSGLTFDVKAANFPVDGVYYEATPNPTLTHGAADPALDRRDWIVAKKAIAPATNGTVLILPGDPASPLVVVLPDIDLSLYYPIKDVWIEAAQTSPKDTSNTLVWNEDVGEPTEFVYASNSANIVVGTNNPSSGTKSIESTNQVKGDKNTFSTVTTRSTDDFSALGYKTQLKEDMGNARWFIKFFDGTSQVGNTYTFKNNQNGFDSSNIASYQELIIDFSKLNLPSSDFDSFQIYAYTDFDGYYMDEVFLYEGSGSTPVTPSIKNFTELDDTPNSYSGEAAKIVAVKATEDGLEFISAGGIGDMILAAVQIVTGAKTFRDAKLLLRNVANTFNGVFTNTNTANRTYTLQDKSGTIAHLDDIAGQVVEKTGSTIVFTERANYNKLVPISSGDITIDNMGAVKDVVLAVFVDSATEPDIINENLIIRSGRFLANTLCIYWFTWFDTGYILNIQQERRQMLSTPSNFKAIVTGTTEITLTWDAVDNVDTYSLLSSTTDDISTASEIYNNSDLEYINTGLTISVPVYYWVKATIVSINFLDSDYATDSGTPSASYTLFFDLFKGTVINTAKWNVVEDADVGITQDDGIIFTDLQTNGSIAVLEINTNTKFNVDTASVDPVVITFQGGEDIPVGSGFFAIMFKDGILDMIRFATTGGGYNVSIYEGGSSVYSVNYVDTTDYFNHYYKIRLESGIAYWYVWNGSSWTLKTSNAFTADIFDVGALRAGSSDIGDVYRFDYIYVTNFDFATLIP